MEQGPSWKANRSSVSQGYSPYLPHSQRPLVPILSQINPVHASPSHFLNIHFNFVLPFRTVQVVSFPKVSPPKPRMYLSCLTYMSHAPPVSLITRIIWDQEEWDGQEANTKLYKRIRSNARAVFLIWTVKYSFELLTSESAVLTCVLLQISADRCIQPFCSIMKFNDSVILKRLFALSLQFEDGAWRRWNCVSSRYLVRFKWLKFKFLHWWILNESWSACHS